VPDEPEPDPSDALDVELPAADEPEGPGDSPAEDEHDPVGAASEESEAEGLGEGPAPEQADDLAKAFAEFEREAAAEPAAAEQDGTPGEPPEADEPDGTDDGAAAATERQPGAGRLPGSTPSMLNRQLKLRDAQRLADAAEEPAFEPFADAVERIAEAMAAMSEGRYRDAKNQLKLLVMHGHRDVEILVAQRVAQGHLCREEGNYDEALVHFEVALELAPLAEAARETKVAIAEIHRLRDKQSAGLLERLLRK
jgi:tetratricopeptide (TPR) repeat protein